MASWTVKRLNSGGTSFSIASTTTTTLETVPGATVWQVSKFGILLQATGGTSMTGYITAAGMQLLNFTIYSAGNSIPGPFGSGVGVSTGNGYIDLVQSGSLYGLSATPSAKNSIILNAADTITIVTTNRSGSCTLTGTYIICGQDYA